MMWSRVVTATREISFGRSTGHKRFLLLKLSSQFAFDLEEFEHLDWSADRLDTMFDCKPCPDSYTERMPTF